MIRQIRGTIAYVTDSTVEVEVAGICYQVRVAAPTEQFVVGSEISFATHLAVRENALDLYGFADRDSLEIFELLITLPKIGPKSAQQILKQADITLLKESVRNDNASYLSKMSGIGKKSAEKIVAGLKEKFKDIDEPLSAPTGAESRNEYARDTVDALLTLGYTQEDARRTVKIIIAEHTDARDTNEMVRRALQILGNG